jgi:transmembrane sensor
MGKRLGQSEIDRKVALDARDWIVRLSSGNVSRAELERFHAWRAQSPEHDRAFAREQEFWQLLEGVSDRGELAAMAPPAAARWSFSRRAILAGTAFAGAAAAIAAPRLLTWMTSDFATRSGEQTTARLPDGSTMLLNTNSRVALDFRPDLRLVELIDGEAEFTVRPDIPAPFRVAALGGQGETAAGRFAMRSVEGEVAVTVAEGVVSVASGDPAGARSAVLVAAGQQTRYAEGGVPLPAAAVDLDVELAWRAGRLVFEGEPFRAAVRELGRYVPERLVIATHAYDDSPVSAVVQTRDAHAAIEALAHVHGLAAHRIPGVVILIS